MGDRREWDVNAVMTGGRHLGRVTAKTGAEAVRKAVKAKTAEPKLCAKCETQVEDLQIDMGRVVATEVGGSGEVHRSGEPETRSPAYKLVSHVWQHKQGGTGHSWARVNAAMSQALCLAIEAGLLFAEDDFREIYGGMRGGYWFGETSERFYSLAVKFDHESACRSFEAWKGRLPFVFGGSRLHVGAMLDWDGEANATVTSFASDGGSLVACTYKRSEDIHSHQIARRMTITYDELKAAEKGRVAANKEARAIATLRDKLRRKGFAVSAEAIGGWDKKQRAEALAWTDRAWSDHEKPAPDFVLTAQKAAA